MERYEKQNKISKFIGTLSIPVFLTLFLAITSQYNYLMFHVFAELFAIIVAVLISVVAWQMYPFTKNNYLMVLGCGYFWIAALDLIHMMTYKGMGILPSNVGNISIQYWIVARFLEASLLLISPFFLTKKLYIKSVFYTFGVISAVGVYSVTSGYFPEMYITGVGLADAKIISEYIIIGILILACIYLWNRQQYLDKRMVYSMIAAMILTMLAELAFTLYIDVYGVFNVIGHIFKLFSYWLIFIVMIKLTLHEPFSAIAHSANTYECMPDATLLLDQDGVIHQANKAACQLVDLELDDLLGKPSHDIFHPHSISREECQICTDAAGGKEIKAYEFEDIKRKQWLDYSLSPITGVTNLDGYIEVYRNITKRKRLDLELDHLGKLKNAIIENLPSILFVKDAENLRFVEWNKEAELATGYSSHEMIGKNDFDIFDSTEASFYTEIDRQVLESGELLEIEEEPLHTKDGNVILLHTLKIPIFDDHGNASYLLGISQDITDKRETEEILRHSQKMEVVGQLSGGIAHDFNNQLGIVTGYLEFLKEYLKENVKQKAWADNANKAALRCVDLTKQLMLFARSKPIGKEPLNINEVINSLQNLIQKSLTPEVEIKYIFDEKINEVQVNSDELEDAVINMILNSRDAMVEGGEVVIRTEKSYLESDVGLICANFKAGEYSLLEISDNGIGMQRETAEHLFEPFFTTKGVGKGTGLGMSMVYAFMQRHDGCLKVISSPGAGCVIQCYFPVLTQNTKDVEEVAPQDTGVLPVGTESILIVDDEIDLLNLANDFFTSLGYQTYTAENAEEALKVLGSNKIDVLFSDIVMPGGFNGYELADKVRKKYPKTKILLTSGYAGKSTGSIYKAVYEGMIISKPYTRDTLARRVRAILDE